MADVTTCPTCGVAVKLCGGRPLSPGSIQTNWYEPVKSWEDPAAVERSTEDLFQSGLLDEIAAAAVGGRLDERDCIRDALAIVRRVLRAAAGEEANRG